MLDVKEAVKTSVSIFQDLFPPAVFQEPRLEEIDRSDDDQRWKITLSYKNPDIEDEISTRQAESSSLAAALGARSTTPVHPRHYKLITISALDGALIGIKNA